MKKKWALVSIIMIMLTIMLTGIGEAGHYYEWKNHNTIRVFFLVDTPYVYVFGRFHNDASPIDRQELNIIDVVSVGYYAVDFNVADNETFEYKIERKYYNYDSMVSLTTDTDWIATEDTRPSKYSTPFRSYLPLVTK